MNAHSAARRRLLPAAVACLLAASANAHVDLDYPNGGVTLQAGSTATIVWYVVVQHDTLDWDLEYSLNGGDGPWLPIALGLPLGDPTPGSMHTFDWIVPDTPSHAVSVRVRQNNENDIDYYDQSAGEFSILGSSLNADVSQLSISAGGVQNLDMDAGAVHGNETFLLLGSVSGTSPGVPLGVHVLPLNPDFYLSFVLTHPAGPPLVGAAGTLDAAGRANAQFATGPGVLPSSLAGTHVNHAFIVVDVSASVTFVSNPMLLDLVN